MFTIYAGTKRITQETITDKAARVRQLLQDADAVIIGAGAGLSTAAGNADPPPSPHGPHPRPWILNAKSPALCASIISAFARIATVFRPFPPFFRCLCYCSRQPP
jgi:hypothetical protein